MIAPSPRLVLGAATLAAVAGLVAVTVPDTPERRAELGTEGDGRGEADLLEGPDAPVLVELAPGDTPEEGSEDLETTAEAVSTTTTRAAAPSTAAPPQADPGRASDPPSTVPPAPVPRSLAGRIAHLRPGPNGAGVAELWSTLPDGSDLRREVSCPDEVGFAGTMDVSPDGTEVVRACGDPSPEVPSGLRLVVQDVASGAMRTIVPATDLFAVSYPSWSPDGRWIAITHFGGPWVDVVDTTTWESRRLELDGPEPDGTLSWSADSSTLLTTSGKLFSRDGGPVTQLDLTDLTPGSGALVDLLAPLEATVQGHNARYGSDGQVYVDLLIGGPEAWTPHLGVLLPGGGAVPVFEVGRGDLVDVLRDGSFLVRNPFVPEVRIIRDGQVRVIPTVPGAHNFVAVLPAGLATTG